MQCQDIIEMCMLNIERESSLLYIIDTKEHFIGNMCIRPSAIT